MRTKKITVDVVKETKSFMVISDVDIPILKITPKTISLQWSSFDKGKLKVSKKIVTSLLDYIESGKLESFIKTPGFTFLFDKQTKVKAGSVLTTISDAEVYKRKEGYEGYVHFTAGEVEEEKTLKHVLYQDQCVKCDKDSVRIGCVRITKAELEDIIEEMEKL